MEALLAGSVSAQHFSRALVDDMDLQPAARGYICTVCTKAAVSMTQQFRHVAVPLIVILPRSALQPAQNNGCGLLPQKVCRPMLYGMRKVDA